MPNDEFEEYSSQQNYKENIFFSVDDLIENIILEFLKKDTIDSNKLIKILNEKNEHTNWYEIQSNINQKWRKVYRDFKYSRKDFATEINQIFEENRDNMQNILNFEQLFVYLEFIKNIPFEINKDTEELMIKNYIDKHIKYNSFDNEIEEFVNKNYQNLNFYLKEKRDKKLIEDITLDSVNLTLKKVKQSFSREDEYILDNISSKKYKSFILESSSFSENIISFLFSRYNSDNNFKQAIVNIKEALDELKNENEDYAFKVEKIYNQIKKR